ncbi:extracellular solute-binding protein [Aerococcus agrisoli]|uniref:Extracellular solute-binding protein n=1 Tax=Aerococcus agrisoli TaxID=2487350 RepID=A0A3N4GXM8_9LACT|nr:substrate-binding domain-containing protein [Aerococcus agrisoli]RPA65476.1 extracellular solute-binding protein [Aerococcus agrisoli]
MTFNKFSKLVLALGASAALAACGNSASTEESSAASSDATSTESSSAEATNAVTGAISVISREEGSGTRDAFIEATGVMEDDVDNTSAAATIMNGTDQVMTAVADDPNAIGYISLGSLNDTVKAVSVDGVAPTEETVADGSYAISRPFNIVYQGELEGVVADFHDFIFSEEGQAIVVEEGYVAADAEAAAYEGDGSQSGSINVVGSTSVSPVMEKIAEAYQAANPDVQVNITSNGSSAGVTAAAEGTADLGMASRALAEDETGVTAEAIATDGVAVIVNPENGLEDISVETIKGIFTGEITDWADVQ